MLIVTFTCQSPAMAFFEDKIFTLGKTEKMLISLFTTAAKEALGDIPDDYTNRDPLDFTEASLGSLQLMECYLTELLLLLMRTGCVLCRKGKPRGAVLTDCFTRFYISLYFTKTEEKFCEIFKNYA